MNYFWLNCGRHHTLGRWKGSQMNTWHLFFPDRVELVAHVWLPALFSLHDGGPTLGQRDLLPFCTKEPCGWKWLQLDEQILGAGFVLLQFDKLGLMWLLLGGVPGIELAILHLPGKHLGHWAKSLALWLLFNSLVFGDTDWRLTYI